MREFRADTPAGGRRKRRAWRQEIAQEIAEDHGGVASHQLLLEAGLTRQDIRAELERGTWCRCGVHTLGIEGSEPQGIGKLWWGVWESGSRAVLDGVSALLAAGLKNWDETLVWVSVPHNAKPRRQPGLVIRTQRDLGPVVRNGLPRTKPALAVVRAALWARSDRAAATVLAMAVQQRLVHPDHVIEHWHRRRRGPRREFLDTIVSDICDGAHALGELDFARLCRARGLPAPSRQVVCKTPQGRIYLDVRWEDRGVRAEINGAQHYQGLQLLNDSLRNNEAAINGDVTLQIPVLGLRLDADAFMDQVERAVLAAGS